MKEHSDLDKQFFIKNTPPAPRFDANDAKIIGVQLQAIAARGSVTAEALVEIAKSSNSPLHQFFDWEDKSAAAANRLDIAKTMIRTVLVRISSAEGTARGLAATRVMVKRVHVEPVKPAKPMMAQVKGKQEEKLSPKMQLARALDADVEPKSMSDAINMIVLLRERIESLEKLLLAERSTHTKARVPPGESFIRQLTPQELMTGRAQRPLQPASVPSLQPLPSAHLDADEASPEALSDRL